MTTRSSKQKGKRAQNAVRDTLLAAFPELEPGDIKSCTMGEPGLDIQLSPLARSLFPYDVECKARKSHAIDAYYEQAAKYGKGEPIVVTKSDRKAPLVTMSMGHFLALLGRAPKSAPANQACQCGCAELRRIARDDQP